MEAQAALPVCSRVRVAASDMVGSGTISPYMVASCGVGYMVNTGAASDWNVTVDSMRLKKGHGRDMQLCVHPLGLPIVYYKAMRVILPHEELIARYGNNDSRIYL